MAEKKKTNKKKKQKTSYSAAYIARLGVMVAVALLFSYIETFISFGFGVPGIKIGLANIVTIVVLCSSGLKDGAIVSALRIFMATLLFGNLAMLPYSLGGAVVSLLVMWLVNKFKFFTITGVSVFGGVAHNAGQLFVAYLWLGSSYVLAYAPALIISGTIGGVLVGLVAGVITNASKEA